MKLYRAESLNDSPLFVRAVADLARARLSSADQLAKRLRLQKIVTADMKRIAIIGGGISGLSAAFYLEKARAAGADLEYTLFESGQRLGGSMYLRSHRRLPGRSRARFLPHRKALGGDALQRAGHRRPAHRLQRCAAQDLHCGTRPPGRHARRADVHGADQAGSHGAVAAVLVEHQDPHGAGAAASAAADAGRRNGRRTGRAPLRRRRWSTAWPTRCSPASMAAMRRKLSARAVLPRFVEMEEKYGSLSRAMLAAHKKMAACRHKSPPRPLFTSLQDGMQQMVDALIVRAWIPQPSACAPTSCAFIPRTAAGASAIEMNGDERYDAVILATPANVAGDPAGRRRPRARAQPARHHLQLIGHRHARLLHGPAGKVCRRDSASWCRAARARACWHAPSSTTSFRIARRRTKASCAASWAARAMKPSLALSDEELLETVRRELKDIREAGCATRFSRVCTAGAEPWRSTSRATLRGWQRIEKRVCGNSRAGARRQCVSRHRRARLHPLGDGSGQHGCGAHTRSLSPPPSRVSFI